MLQSSSVGISDGQVPAQGTRQASRFRTARLLWIDDEITLDSSSLHLLKAEGLAVDCAESAAAAVQRMGVSPYDGIILDLCLPDMSGLALLRSLRGMGIQAPVMVVSGYANVDVAVDLMKAGAVDVKQKPLIGQDLLSAVHSLLNAHSACQPSLVVMGDTVDWSSYPSQHRQPSHLATTEVPPSAAAASICAAQSRESLARQLAGILIDPKTELFAFVACAKALRACWIGGETTQSLEPQAASGVAPPCSDRVLWALEKLEKAAERGLHLSEEAVAQELFVDRAHLGRLIIRETGLAFRDVRRALRMRRAVREFGRHNVRISEVAHKVGYEHSQFTREFGQLLGTTPRRFCSLLCQRSGLADRK